MTDNLIEEGLSISGSLCTATPSSQKEEGRRSVCGGGGDCTQASLSSPFKLSQTYFRSKKKTRRHKTKILLFWACRGVEPGTSRTLSENHATRPTGHPYQASINSYSIYFPFPGDVYHKMPPILYSSTTFWKNFFLKFWAGYKSIAILREG